jgi:hypothetical protein
LSPYFHTLVVDARQDQLARYDEAVFAVSVRIVFETQQWDPKRVALGATQGRPGLFCAPRHD